MRQRAAIAAALLMQPDILVADEPTTALDVTMEAQIIHLLRELRDGYQGAIVVVTHHLGVIAELCDRVYVMYAGEVVEEGLVDDIYHAPQAPLYARAASPAIPPHLEERTALLPTIAGRVPDLTRLPPGCSFAARCAIATELCREAAPPWVRISGTQGALCHEVTRMTALLEVEDLSVDLPAAGGFRLNLLPGTAPGAQHPRRRHAVDRCRRNLRPRRRVGLGQDHAGPHHPGPCDRLSGGSIRFAGQTVDVGRSSPPCGALRR